MRFFKFIAAIIILGSLLSGCSFTERWVYRPDINQGNFLTKKDVDQLQVGQTKAQVAFIMGSPMLKSVFSDDSWYYVFRTQPQHDVLSQQTVTIVFDQKGHVTEIQNSSSKN